MSFITMLIEKAVTGFICIGLFAFIGEKVADIVHLSTLTLQKHYLEVKKALSKSEE